MRAVAAADDVWREFSAGGIEDIESAAAWKYDVIFRNFRDV